MLINLLIAAFLFLSPYASAQDVVAPIVDLEIETVPELSKEERKLLELEKEISQQTAKIEKTEEEIRKINTELDKVQSTRKTLQTQYNSFTLINKQNKTKIRLTEENVRRSVLSLESLNADIDESAKKVTDLKKSIRSLHQKINEFDLKAGYLNVFTQSSLFETVRSLEESIQISESATKFALELKQHTSTLRTDRIRVAKERKQLELSKQELKDRERLYEISLRKQKAVLAEVKDDENEFQRLLEKKLEERVSLQKELIDYESQIEFIKDDTFIPPPQRGVLDWPLSDVRITQLYGNTPFARQNRKRYGRAFHDGLDLAAQIGTQLLSVAEGRVISHGDTDTVSSCQHFGKWIAIEHNNGLTTLYAHLSLIRVREGQEVKRGEVIGYTGNSGFSTGAHLHLGVYASKGFRIIPYSNISTSSRCAGLDVPIAHEDAKINPLEYLPAK